MKCKICKKPIRGEGEVLYSSSTVGKPIVSHICMRCYKDPVKMDELKRKHDELLSIQDRLFDEGMMNKKKE